MFNLLLLITAWIKQKALKLITMGLPSLIGSVLLLCASIFFLYLSWGKWPDILVDFGRELFIPWQLAQGKVLYRDIFFYYGPFSKYLTAFFFKIFSPKLSVLIITNAVFGLIFIITSYRLMRFWASRGAATLALGGFLALFAFGQYTGIANYNFLCPYSHELLHGFILACLALLCTFYYIKTPSLKMAFFIGFFSGLVFLSKVEVFAALSGALLTGAALSTMFLNPPKKKASIDILVLIAGFCLPVFLFYIYFISKMGFDAATQAFFFPYLIIFKSQLSSNVFYKAFSGWDNPTISLQRMLFSFFALTAAVCISFLSAYFIGRIKQPILRSLTAIFIFLILTTGILILVTRYLAAYEIFRFLPLTTSIIWIFFMIRIFRLRHTPNSFGAWAGGVFATFSTLMLLKISLYGHIFHSGFILSLPAFMLFFTVVFDEGSFCIKWCKGSATLFQSIIIAFLLGIIVSYGMINLVYGTAKHYVFGSDKGSFKTYSPKYSSTGPVFNEVLSYLKKIPPTSTIAVLPEGVTLNFFSGLTASTPYFEFSPSFFEMSPESAVLSAFQKNPPDYIIFVDRDMTEHGAQYFGRDYAKNLYAWLIQTYQPVQLIGNQPFSGKGFGVLIAKKIMLKSS